MQACRPPPPRFFGECACSSGPAATDAGDGICQNSGSRFQTRSRFAPPGSHPASRETFRRRCASACGGCHRRTARPTASPTRSENADRPGLTDGLPGARSPLFPLTKLTTKPGSTRVTAKAPAPSRPVWPAHLNLPLCDAAVLFKVGLGSPEMRRRHGCVSDEPPTRMMIGIAAAINRRSTERSGPALVDVVNGGCVARGSDQVTAAAAIGSRQTGHKSAYQQRHENPERCVSRCLACLVGGGARGGFSILQLCL